MIKYAKIEGYKNVGEVETFSHIYQFIEEGRAVPAIILVRAYDGEAKVFKGYLYTRTRTFIRKPLLDSEREVIEQYIGKASEASVLDIVKDTIFEDLYKGFVEKEVEVNG